MKRFLTNVSTSSRLALFIVSVIVGTSSILAGCASKPLTYAHGSTANIDTVNLTTLENLSTLTVPNAGAAGAMGGIREQAIKETATSLGAQGGLAWESNNINHDLEKNDNELNVAFNFGELLLPNNVLPPVLEQSNQVVNLDNPNTLRIADKTYKIVKQARFVTTSPTWHAYLIMKYKKPEVPDRTLLPKTPSEQRVWAPNIQRGWIQGIQQAKMINFDNMARLKRDYNGMLLYRELLARKMVSKPYVASTDLGVTSNKAHSQIYIGDKVLRITALPQLNPDSKKWQPILTQ